MSPSFMRLLFLLFSLGVSGCANVDEAAAPATPTPTPAAATASVVTGKAPRGSVVMLASTSVAEYPLPAGPAVMDQIGKAFVPEVLIVRVGQPVEFRNSEDMDHNVIVVRSRTGQAIFNASPPPFQKHVHTFTVPGMYSVSCDIHPGMRGTVVATTTPYAVMTGAGGTFSFGDVAPGTYKISVIADRADVDRTIEVRVPSTDVGELLR